MRFCRRFLMVTVMMIPFSALAAENIRVVGSSTVYPFVTAAADEFSARTGQAAPIVESTGTGGGFKLFCSGVGKGTPDMSNASRAIKSSEVELCAKNGVKDVTEIMIGYDGIVLANSMKAPQYQLTLEQLFLALARQVPGKDGKLAANPYQKWNEIDPSLPDKKIEVYGPPPTSGTRDAFVELVMDVACEKMEAFKAAYADGDARKKACQLLREDGAFIEAGENDNLIVQKLVSNPDALGIFGYSFLEQNMSLVHGSVIDGKEPSFENIADGSYPIARPLFVYAKDAHLRLTAGLADFMRELVSEEATGKGGYLADKGLIPLPEDKLKTVRDKVLAKLPKA